MKPSIKDIAEQVGISKAAVSIYLSDPQTRRVGSRTKEKIRKAVNEMNYRPNAVARALSSSKTKIIGILIPYNSSIFRSTFADEMLSGIQSVLYPRGYSMLFMPAEGKSSRDMVANHLENGLGYDGYILFGTRFCTLDDMKHNAELMKSTHLPFVVVNMPEIDMEINQTLDMDPPETNVADYLLRLGHRQIVLVAGRENAPESRLAIENFKSSLESHGIETKIENILYGDYERDVARSVMLKRIDSGEDFTAVYTLADTMAAGIYEALKHYGLRIPEDVTVVGRNNSFFSNLMDPPLTTVSRPIFELGARAADSVLRTIDGAEDTRKVVLKTTLIQRTSSAPRITETNPEKGKV